MGTSVIGNPDSQVWKILGVEVEEDEEDDDNNNIDYEGGENREENSEENEPIN